MSRASGSCGASPATAPIKDVATLGLDVAGLASNYAGILEIGQVAGSSTGSWSVTLRARSSTKPDKFTELGVHGSEDVGRAEDIVGLIKGKGTTPPASAPRTRGRSPTGSRASTSGRPARTSTTLFGKDGNWEDQSVKDAIARLTGVLTDDVVGGINGALGAGFVDGIGQVFKPDPAATMYYEGGFVYGIATGDVNKDLKLGETIDWFDFVERPGRRTSRSAATSSRRSPTSRAWPVLQYT